MVDASEEPVPLLTKALCGLAHKHPAAKQDITPLLSQVHKLQAPVCADAQPIAEAPMAGVEHPYLLYCPEEGGWHVGVFFEERWVDLATLTVELKPTHWMPVPPEPQ